jgi:hypothetical protein
MSLSPEVLQQRYAAIELAYSERLWPDVERLSAELLAELPESPADPLRLRLGLLLGHTRLYGWGDGATARAHYSGVLSHSQEPTLREIAQQGLEQCQQLEQAQRQSEQQAAHQGLAAESSGNGPATAAAPWLAELGQSAAPATAALHAPAAAGENAAPWLQGAGSPAEPVEAADAATPPAEPMGAELSGETASEELAEDLEEGLAEDLKENLAEPDEPAPAIALDLNSVEIVEEPEQIAVALADPSRREEIALRELASEPSDPLQLDEAALSAEELAALNRGLLRVVLR